MRIIRTNQPITRSHAPYAWSLASGLDAEINRFLNEAFSDMSVLPSAAAHFPVDLYEDKNNTYVRAELPGVDRANLSVELVDDALTLTATRKTAAPGRDETQTLSRSLQIPESVQPDKVTAALENGILTVTLPKREEAKPRKINVSIN